MLFQPLDSHIVKKRAIIRVSLRCEERLQILTCRGNSLTQLKHFCFSLCKFDSNKSEH